MAKKAWKELEGQFFRIDVGSTQAEALASEESNVLYITTEQSMVMNGEILGRAMSYIRLMCNASGSTKPAVNADGYIVTLDTYGCFKVQCDGNFSFKTLPSSVVGVDMSHWNPIYLTTMAKAFYNMTKVKRLDLSGVDVSNVTNMSNAFAGMYALEELDVSTWDTRKVTDMTTMFASCRAIKELDLRSFCLSGLTQTSVTLFSTTTQPECVWLGSQFFNSPVLTSITLQSGKWTDATSVNESLYTNLFNRKAAGQPTLKISLSTATKGVLTDTQKTRLTNYGYTLA